MIHTLNGLENHPTIISFFIGYIIMFHRISSAIDMSIVIQILFCSLSIGTLRFPCFRLKKLHQR